MSVKNWYGIEMTFNSEGEPEYCLNCDNRQTGQTLDAEELQGLCASCCASDIDGCPTNFAGRDYNPAREAEA